MFGRHIFTEEEYVSYVGRKGAYRGLLTWKGTVQVPFDGTQAFLDKVYEENLPLVRGNLERKEKQSAAAKAGGPGGQKADPHGRAHLPSENAKLKLTPVPPSQDLKLKPHPALRSRRLIRYHTVPCARSANPKRRSKTILGA